MEGSKYNKENNMCGGSGFPHCSKMLSQRHIGQSTMCRQPLDSVRVRLVVVLHCSTYSSWCAYADNLQGGTSTGHLPVSSVVSPLWMPIVEESLWREKHTTMQKYSGQTPDGILTSECSRRETNQNFEPSTYLEVLLSKRSNPQEDTYCYYYYYYYCGRQQ